MDILKVIASYIDGVVYLNSFSVMEREREKKFRAEMTAREKKSAERRKERVLIHE